MSSYRLTARADTELLDISLYTIETFSARQADRYRESLQRCFQMIADNPRMRRKVAALGEGIRRHEHQSLVILYKIDDEGVHTSAIVHKRSVRGLEL